MVIVTIACLNYVPKVLNLVKTIKDANIKATLALCVVEATHAVPDEIASSFDYICFPSDLGYQNVEYFMFLHTVVEAAAAVKARVLLHMMSKFSSEEVFIFLDPDIWVFSSFEEVFISLDQGEICVTPHLLMNEASPEQAGPGIFNLLKGGVFNLGFLAIRRSQRAESFLMWWRDRLDHWCYVDNERGLFADQKWVELASGFTDLVIVRQPNYNVAHWNIVHRHIEKSGSIYTVNGVPLRFIHFSGVNGRGSPGIEKYLEWVPSDNAIHQLTEEYLDRLDHFGYQSYRGKDWGYSRYHSGEVISQKSRLILRDAPELSAQFSDPFSSSNDAILSGVQ